MYIWRIDYLQTNIVTRYKLQRHQKYKHTESFIIIQLKLRGHTTTLHPGTLHSSSTPTSGYLP